VRDFIRAKYIDKRWVGRSGGGGGDRDRDRDRERAGGDGRRTGDMDRDRERDDGNRQRDARDDDRDMDRRRDDRDRRDDRGGKEKDRDRDRGGARDRGPEHVHPRRPDDEEIELALATAITGGPAAQGETAKSDFFPECCRARGRACRSRGSRAAHTSSL